MAQYINGLISGADDDSTVIDWPGGPGVFACQGTFGGITLKLKFNINGSLWNDVEGTNMVRTVNGMGNFEIFPCKIHVRGNGGDGTTAVHVRVTPSWQGWFNEGTLLEDTEI